MMNGSYDGMMNGEYGWMFVWFFIVVAVLAIAIFAVVKFARPGQEQPDEAHQLLRRRYASGEIDADEYASRQVGLGQSH